MSRKLLVIGAQGTVGAFVSRLFADAGWEVTRAGRRPEYAPDFRLLDLADPVALSKLCAQADVVVNTAHHPELGPERTVLRDGGILLDLAELTQPARTLLSGAQEGGRGLVVTDTGLAGVAYLMLAQLLKANPQAEEAEYALMFSASGSTGRAGALLSYKLLTGRAHHPSVKVPFPSPFGVRSCLEVGPDEETLLRSTIAGVPVRHHLCMQPRALNGLLLALNRAHLISMLPQASFTASVGKVPAKPSEEHICELVAIGAGGRRLAVRTIEARGYYAMTAAAMLAFADALTEAGMPDGRRGLLSIEEALTLDAVRPALERHSVHIREQPVAPGQSR